MDYEALKKIEAQFGVRVLRSDMLKDMDDNNRPVILNGQVDQDTERVEFCIVVVDEKSVMLEVQQPETANIIKLNAGAITDEKAKSIADSMMVKA